MFRLTPVFMGDFEEKGKGFCSQKLQNPETVQSELEILNLYNDFLKTIDFIRHSANVRNILKKSNK